jgi:hypothetical protein
MPDLPHAVPGRARAQRRAQTIPTGCYNVTNYTKVYAVVDVTNCTWCTDPTVSISRASPSRCCDCAFLNSSVVPCAVNATVRTTTEQCPAIACVSHPYALSANGTYQSVSVCHGPSYRTNRCSCIAGLWHPWHAPLLVRPSVQQLSCGAAGHVLCGQLRSQRPRDCGGVGARRFRHWAHTERGRLRHGSRDSRGGCQHFHLDNDSRCACRHRGERRARRPRALSPGVPQRFTVTASSSSTFIGPSFPLTFTARLALPASALYDNVSISLPLNPAFLLVNGSVTTSASLVSQQLPTSTPAQPPNNTMLYVFGPGSGDVVVQFLVTVPTMDAYFNYTISPVTAADASASQSGSVAFVFSGGVTVTTFSSSVTVRLKAVEVTESTVISTNVGDSLVTPNDTLTTRLNVVTAHYFHLGSVVVTHTIGDGLVYDASVTPYAVINGSRVNFTTGLTVNNSRVGFNTSDCCTDGTQILTFAVSSTALAAGLLGNSNGALLGPTSTYIVLQVPCVRYAAASSVASPLHRIMQKRARASFTDTLSRLLNTTRINQGDVIASGTVWNTVLRNDSSVNATVAPIAPSTSSSVTMAQTPTLTLNVYAIDGVVCSGGVCSSPLLRVGGNVTLSLLYYLPFTAWESFVVTVYLPTPMLAASELNTSQIILNVNATPQASFLSIGRNETLYNRTDLLPTASKNASINAFVLRYPVSTYPTDELGSRIHMLATLTVSDTPWSDLYDFSTTGSSSEGWMAATSVARTSFKVKEPVPSISVASRLNGSLTTSLTNIEAGYVIRVTVTLVNSGCEWSRELLFVCPRTVVHGRLGAVRSG